MPKVARSGVLMVNHHEYTPESWLSQYCDNLKERRGWQTARSATALQLAHARDPPLALPLSGGAFDVRRDSSVTCIGSGHTRLRRGGL